MGPIELVFLSIMALFGVIGIVRGYARELGVTIVLLAGLLVLVFLETELTGYLNQGLAAIAGESVTQQATTKALLFAAFLTGIMFISYQGETLAFPAKGKSFIFSLGSGLLNGYLYAGSLWYYLGSANWPYMTISQPYSQFYQFAWRLLPPNILTWPYLMGLVLFMLIMRVIK